jgi:hypothetical protein
MRPIILALACVFISASAFAQDVDLGLGGDVGSLLNLPAPRGATPARGTTPAGRGGDTRGRGSSAPVDRLARVREILATANLPLTTDQEGTLNALVSNEIPEMRRALQARISELQKNSASSSTPGGLPTMDALAPEIIRLNDELLGKMAVSPGLAPEQQSFLRKVYKDQVKSRGGFDAIKLTLEDAGTPFSADQIAQIQPLFDEKADKQQILAKVLRLLTADQRRTLVTK